MVFVDEEARYHEPHENTENVHLSTNHSCHGSLTLREPVSGDLRRRVVEQRLAKRDNNLTDKRKVKALIDEASDPKTDHCREDAPNDTPSQAKLFDDIDAREVHGQIECHKAVRHAVDDQRCHTI